MKTEEILKALDGCNVKVENGAIIITPSEGISKKYTPKDKELVWCWDIADVARRRVCFYDKKNNCTFRYDCKRDGLKYANYAKYEGEYPQWAKDALELLED